MKLNTLLMGIVFIFSQWGCAQQAPENKSNIKNVSAEEFKTLVESGQGQIVDIRTPGEYNMGHIKDAEMIDFYAAGFADKMEKLDKTKPVFVYCRSGNRSGQTMRLIKNKGFSEVYNLQYGINDWVRNGYELVTN